MLLFLYFQLASTQVATTVSKEQSLYMSDVDNAAFTSYGKDFPLEAYLKLLEIRVRVHLCFDMINNSDLKILSKVERECV